MDIRQWQASGDRQTLLGHEIFTRVEPDTGKPPLLLIHGYPTACWDFEKLWPALSDTFRLVSCDMLGFGFSAKPADHVYSIHQQADIIEALVSHVGLEEYHLLAHDYGDTVAQELLARQNSGNGIGSCLSMCFLNGGLFPETHQALAVQKLLLSPLGKWICRYSGQRSFNRSVSRVFGPDTKPDAVTLDQFWRLVCYNDGNRVLYRLIAAAEPPAACTGQRFSGPGERCPHGGALPATRMPAGLPGPAARYRPLAPDGSSGRCLPALSGIHRG